jgi:hypothetical protein
MNRTNYFNYCEEKLNFLRLRIETGGKLNILSLHLHSEDFYQYFFNLLYGYDLKNMNSISQNTEAIDLIDVASKIVIQVSSTATKNKIQSALNKQSLSGFKGNNFKFISISKDANGLRKKTYLNPYQLVFIPSSDIHDVPSILGEILHLNIDKQKQLYEFIKKELGTEVDEFKVESNLANIIGILAKEDLLKTGPVSNMPVFNIDDKLIFNNLVASAIIVEDHKIHSGRIAKIYSEYDKSGLNKSQSVLSTLRTDYARLRQKYSADELFFKIIEETISKVTKSTNYVPIAFEELELCVSIIVVDAFIRCKIFENPKVVQNAAA